jgi:hypothetical protein
MTEKCTSLFHELNAGNPEHEILRPTMVTLLLWHHFIHFMHPWTKVRIIIPWDYIRCFVYSYYKKELAYQPENVHILNMLLLVFLKLTLNLFTVRLELSDAYHPSSSWKKSHEVFWSRKSNSCSLMLYTAFSRVNKTQARSPSLKLQHHRTVGSSSFHLKRQISANLCPDDQWQLISFNAQRDTTYASILKLWRSSAYTVAIIITDQPS